MPEKSSIFDMIGPVMIGPSSSHTAGVVKIGNVIHKILKETPQKVTITFYNSFARTYEGHGSDRAILAGILGFLPDDKRIKTAFDHAEENGLEFTFKPVGNASLYHPNTIRIVAEKGERKVEILGVSRGGGLISIVEVDGFMSNFDTTLHTLIVLADDRKGSIAFLCNIIAQDESNIANMTVSRKGKNHLACQFMELDSPLRPITLEYIKSLNWVKQLEYITV